MNNENNTTAALLNDELSQELLNQFSDINNNTSLESTEKLTAFHQLFSHVLEQATAEENLHFPTLFSRLAYTGIKYKLPASFLYYAHNFRRSTGQKDIPIDIRLGLSQYVLLQLIKFFWKNSTHLIAPSLAKKVKQFFKKERKEIISFVPYLEAIIIDIDIDQYKIYFIDEEEGEVVKCALFNIADRNELFNQNIISISKHVSLPIPINFIDVEWMEDGTALPRAIVLQPDLLIDVTSIADCFRENGSHSIIHVLHKFRDNNNKTPILLGNMVNFFMEEIIENPSIPLKSLVPLLFKKFGLSLSLLNDEELKELWNKLETHFFNIQRTIREDFPTLGIDKYNSFIESSFYSKKYGIQGRLDLFVFDELKKTFAIVELKSGSPWRPNAYGISASHFTQTQIYEMLISSVYGKKLEHIQNYILYSKEAEKTLRFAPSIKPHQSEVLKVRNEIVVLEELLTKVKENSALLEYINLEKLGYLKGFTADGIHQFSNAYGILTPIEKHYFNHYISFIAKEYSIAKVGEHGIDSSKGHAALWLESLEEKESRFAILSNLKISQNNSEDSDPFLIFQIPKNSKVSNFRKGDIAIIYPVIEVQQPVLYSQVYKCSILHITSDEVTVKLRNKQNNQTYFQAEFPWNLEEDLIDSSFRKLYESLYSFILAPKETKNLFLGLCPPSTPDESIEIKKNPTTTDEQHRVITQALQAKDYFLIWGPPGTGKTNIVLKKLVEELYNNSSETILLVAYTNRAVDEICQSISEIHEEMTQNFVRIGSRTATHPDFIEQLLDVQISKCQNRAEIVFYLQNKRIFVSTVSSILGKPEIFSHKTFDTIIVDEASQILESLLCGLLPKMKRWILIGDHKQLPAVVRQDKKNTIIHNKILNDVGILDTSYSLFDRLFHQCKTSKWTFAYGILAQQGRMHKSLQEFVDVHFYEKNLKPLPGMDRLVSVFYKENEKGISSFLENRRIYINTPKQISGYSKINVHESLVCVSLIKEIEQLYIRYNKSFSEHSIGIITPFRAQIAQIKIDLQQSLPHLANVISIDTVERYQGGARDIIIYSVCANNYNHLQRISNLNHDGVDRKLNVSLTRAREQFIMVGNLDLLSTQPLYKSWIDSAYVSAME
ncbi:MAG: AAA domain-containing protein [Saprospiraceae bacterium]